jgi:short-subunit dehydrogenase
VLILLVLWPPVAMTLWWSREAKIGCRALRKNSPNITLRCTSRLRIWTFPGAAARLAGRVQATGRTIDVLVNNAGFGLAGPFHQGSLTDLSGIIAVNVTALTELSRELLPGMVERRQGKILNVASLAAFQPGPYMAVYYATKAYVLSFSEALWEECRGTGVTVTALCPGPVETRFAERAAMTDIRLFSSGLMPKMSSARVAELGVEGLMRGRRVVIPGATNRFLALASGWTPAALGLRVTRYLQTSTQRDSGVADTPRK